MRGGGVGLSKVKGRREKARATKDAVTDAGRGDKFSMETFGIMISRNRLRRGRSWFITKKKGG